MPRNRSLALPALILAWTLLGPTKALAARSVYFSTPAFRDCYLSIANVSGGTLLVTVSPAGGDGVNAWSLIYARITGGRGGAATCSSPGTACQLAAATSAVFAYSKTYDLAGTFAGTITVTDTSVPPRDGTGLVLASGYCMSDGLGIPFTVIGGSPF